MTPAQVHQCTHIATQYQKAHATAEAARHALHTFWVAAFDGLLTEEEAYHINKAMEAVQRAAENTTPRHASEYFTQTCI